ncbi:molybdate ABC transporter substrate-binding protein [Thermomonas flagellata]|uniref:molybdate ABC transporter substrate-binding protein n=1 Tax=Thermomonas flagellata TaxID=2888524 RepID=UPI001F044964
MHSFWLRSLCLLAGLLLAGAASAGALTVAAAADLKFALDEIVAAYRKAHPQDRIQVVYGSSGKFHTQIQQGAPYDLFFSADIAYPQALVRDGHALAPVRPYAFGRIVLWSRSRDASRMTLASLTDPAIRRIAIANPKHAPYGKRAEEALRAAGLWERVQPKLVFGENVAQTAQFVQTGNADVGIIALSLALSPVLAREGGHWTIPDRLHAPLEQGYVITRRAADNPTARQFAAYMASPAARAVMARYGFVLPGEPVR